ncbi:hypothetical protein BMF94_1740 [Rhodotorula taiwanensis]|uniref:Uncharacterized protein n=1 Tax=Rhodotorula taiwanensis TaxID=741276 RepID=A0A2S5BEC7_9BASI|nr:hypothetical protein BMF94_1740 [Rhodotorula taiwanensis]
MRLLSTAVALCAVFSVPVLAQSSVSNLETFPTIYSGTSTGPESTGAATLSGGASPSASYGAFDPSKFPTAPGPAIIPNYTLSNPSGAASSGGTGSSGGGRTNTGNRTTAVSASAVSITSQTSPTASIVTSTVDGSVTTVTVTSSKGSGAAAQTGTSGAESNRSGSAAGAAALWGAAGTVLVAAFGFTAIL